MSHPYVWVVVRELAVVTKLQVFFWYFTKRFRCIVFTMRTEVGMHYNQNCDMADICLHKKCKQKCIKSHLGASKGFQKKGRTPFIILESSIISPHICTPAVSYVKTLTVNLYLKCATQVKLPFLAFYPH